GVRSPHVDRSQDHACFSPARSDKLSSCLKFNPTLTKRAWSQTLAIAFANLGSEGGTTHDYESLSDRAHPQPRRYRARPCRQNATHQLAALSCGHYAALGQS